MTRKERILATIRRRRTDRVPYATYNLHPYSANRHTADPSYGDILVRVRRSAGAVIKVDAQRPGPDLARRRDAVIETRTGGHGDDRTETTVLHTPRGDLVQVARAPEHRPARVVQPFVRCEEDIAKLMALPYDPPECDTDAIRSVYDAAGDRALVMVTYAEPMYSVASLLGFESFAERCVTDLSSLLRVIAWAQERCEENLRRLLAACRGFEVVLHTSGPELCTPPLLSPSLFPRLVTPYAGRLIRMVHDAGFLAAIHCHGRVRHVLPEILRTEADLLEPIEPPPQGDMVLAELLKESEGRLCVMGHIQDQEFYTAPPGLMTRRVEAIARVARGGVGYIMTPTCTPFDFPCTDTYRRNYLEWLDAAERLLN